MFTDNDDLSGMIASRWTGSLFLLSNVDGIYNGIPGNAGVEIIREICDSTVNPEQFITTGKSGFGRGGMLTKYATARKIASEGVDVFIANGNRDSIVLDILRGRDVPYTRIRRCNGRPKSVKKWLYHQYLRQGSCSGNKGRRMRCCRQGFQPAYGGITGVEGYFEKGDIVRILDENGWQHIGLGKLSYDFEKAEQSIGTGFPGPLYTTTISHLNDELKNGFGS
jgi:glutamate 5-kinase